jgi:hypothetical protein
VIGYPEVHGPDARGRRGGRGMDVAHLQGTRLEQGSSCKDDAPF